MAVVKKPSTKTPLLNEFLDISPSVPFISLQHYAEKGIPYSEIDHENCVQPLVHYTVSLILRQTSSKKQPNHNKDLASVTPPSGKMDGALP